MVLSVVSSGVEGFATANMGAAVQISAAGSVHSAVMLGAAATAVGPIGAVYLAACGPAQANNLTGAVLVGGTHAAIGGAAEASNRSFIAADNV
jgi:hypothetical protein